MRTVLDRRDRRPFMTTAGDGVMDLSGIVAAARAAVEKHFFVK